MRVSLGLTLTLSGSGLSKTFLEDKSSSFLSALGNLWAWCLAVVDNFTGSSWTWRSEWSLKLTLQLFISSIEWGSSLINGIVWRQKNILGSELFSAMVAHHHGLSQRATTFRSAGLLRLIFIRKCQIDRCLSTHRSLPIHIHEDIQADIPIRVRGYKVWSKQILIASKGRSQICKMF